MNKKAEELAESARALWAEGMARLERPHATELEKRLLGSRCFIDGYLAGWRARGEADIAYINEKAFIDPNRINATLYNLAKEIEEKWAE